MSKKNGKNGTALADPSRLNPLDSDDKQILRVVVETPKGSRNKFAFDPNHHLFQLKKVLPTGMAFPYDFGFVPSTEADDGDPIDDLVLTFGAFNSKKSGDITVTYLAANGYQPRQAGAASNVARMRINIA